MIQLNNEALEFAKLNAGVVQPSKTQINPYYLDLNGILGLDFMQQIKAIIK